MQHRSGIVLGLVLAVALTLAGLAAACGDGQEDNGSAGANGADGGETANVQTAIDQVTEMVSAAEQDDLAGAQAAFDAAHDPLHAVIDALEAANSDLASDLDKAVDDAETDLESGEEADHIVEIGNDILDLLQNAATELTPQP